MGAVTISVTGFGLALVTVPLLVLLVPAKPAVVAANFLGLVGLVAVTLDHRSMVSLRRVAPLIGGSLLGLPAGVVVLVVANAAVLRALVGALVIVVAALPPPLLGKIPVGTARWSGLGASYLSGLLQPSTAMSGPPLVIYLLRQRVGPAEFRGSIGTVLIPLSVASLVALSLAGQVTTEALLIVGWAAPGLVAGYAVGRAARTRLAEGTFEGVVRLLLGLAGVAALVSAFSGTA